MNNISLLNSNKLMRKKTQNKTNKNKMRTFVNKCVHHFYCVAHIITWVKESSLYLVISK